MFCHFAIAYRNWSVDLWIILVACSVCLVWCQWIPTSVVHSNLPFSFVPSHYFNRPKARCQDSWVSSMQMWKMSLVRSTIQCSWVWNHRKFFSLAYRCAQMCRVWVVSSVRPSKVEKLKRCVRWKMEVFDSHFSVMWVIQSTVLYPLYPYRPVLNTILFEMQKNATDEGVFAMHTGVGDMSKLGQILSWNRHSTVQTWLNRTDGGASTCNMINGTDTTVFSPHKAPHGTEYIFSTDICRYCIAILNSKSSINPSSSIIAAPSRFSTKKMSISMAFRPCAIKLATIFSTKSVQSTAANVFAWIESKTFRHIRMAVCTKVQWICHHVKVQ